MDVSRIARLSAASVLVALFCASIDASFAAGAPTTTTITNLTPPGPISAGSSTMVSVAVAANSGTPTGTATVSDGTGPSCQVTLAGGTGSCALTPLTAGSKSVTAHYDGDANFLESTSAAVTLSVTPPARTVTSSAGSNGSLSPASQYVVDGSTASFSVTPNSGYTADIGGTCPPGSLDDGVYTTGPITGDCTVAASFVSAASVLSVQVTDNHVYARYGMLLDYVVTVSNSAGVDVDGLTISGGTSPDLDTGSGHWVCFGSNTQCQSQGQGAFSDNAVAIRAKGSVSWIVTVPLLQDAPDTTVDYAVSLDSPSFAAAVTQTDTDTLVVFHDAFDVPYGDGAQAISPTLLQQWDGVSALTFRMVEQFGGMSSSPELLLQARAGDQSGFRVERIAAGAKTWLRAVAIDARGREHASAWSRVAPNALLALGIAGTPAQPTLVLLGAKTEISWPIEPAGSWRVQGSHRVSAE